MSSSTTVSPYNVPNLLTSIRFILAVGVIAFIAMSWFGTALVTFVIAASTDWMDGYYARRYGQVTKLGRIFDPFVDKIIVCGAFTSLVEISGSGVAAWMAIIVIGRELLVTSLRGMVEGAGGDFSASQLGKWKMVLQCVAIGFTLLCLALQTPEPWLVWVTMGTLWGAILLTVYSGIDYVIIASRVMTSETPAK
ncbi:CDP-diacylglycerol--glycerol-3-phosphate 3-phosphatidyltransferase [Roseimaritima multifibrata]|nr:CDP-diacylglycerol--glycerol-3-phosphate 3-phosphatidyltransferase [Roseimaritima multifibrata]